MKFFKPHTGGWKLLEDHGIQVNNFVSKYFIFEKLNQGDGYPTYTNAQLVEMGKIFNWNRLGNVECYVAMEMSTNSANVYHAARADKVSCFRYRRTCFHPVSPDYAPFSVSPGYAPFSVSYVRQVWFGRQWVTMDWLVVD